MAQESLTAKIPGSRTRNIILFGVWFVIVVSVTGVSTLPARKELYQGVMEMQVANVTKEDVAYLLNITKNLQLLAGFQLRNTFIFAMYKDRLVDVENHLEKRNLKYHVTIEDYQSLIDQEEEGICQRKAEYKSRDFDFANHHTYNEIISYLWELSQCSKMVNVEPIGRTFEGRDILLTTISAGTSNKPIIFLDCTVHAKEWGSTSVCLWILNELSTKYHAEPEIKTLLDSYDWNINLLSNPDGYAYTWTKDRLWRKNRAVILNSTCIGVDLNRNFGTILPESTEGSSSDPCSGNYMGPFLFSEAETQATKEVLERSKNRIKMALFVHSYGQLWMSPYAVNTSLPDGYEQMEKIMKAATSAIEATSGTKFKYGSYAKLLYISKNTAMDYAFSELNITHSYTIELSDNGYGFTVPVENIVPKALETWNGIKAAVLALNK